MLRNVLERRRIKDAMTANVPFSKYERDAVS